MSEPMAGVEATLEPTPPRDAAAVVLFRRVENGAEVFWLKRERALRFAGGFFAFPGGRVDAADAAVPVEGASGEPATLIAAAARELLEETGVLVAAGGKTSQSEVDALRREVLETPGTFGEGLSRLGLRLRQDDFTPVGRWLTPASLPTRYDTRFFLVEAPAHQHAQVWPGELSAGSWTRPAEALTRWERGEVLLHPPNLHAMRVMAEFRDAPRAAGALRQQPFCEDHVAYRIEFQKGVHLFPMRSLTLPPATHTNCYLLGTGDLLIVDPGSSDRAELERLKRLLAELRAEGLVPRAVVVTHHHGDHVSGVGHLLEELRLPLWAHPLTASRMPWPVARMLSDGEILTLAGPRPMRWRVLHTPGHARGHLCLIDETSRAAVVGDMVAGFGTIVIDPPEGDMADYLAQLIRLRDLPIGTLYPAHGPATPHGVDKVEEYLTHRAWREAKVVAALERLGSATVGEVVPLAYDDVAGFVLPLAERSTLAILEKLTRETRVLRRDDRYGLVDG